MLPHQTTTLAPPRDTIAGMSETIRDTACEGLLPRRDNQPTLEQALVMLVDDEPLTTEVVQRHLEVVGYKNFVTCCDATQALATLERERPDVLLLDLMMPGVSGFDILSAMRADRSLQRIPVIMLTAAADADRKLKALELGATDFLAKPVDSSELVLRVRNTLTVKHYQDHLEREIERQTEKLARAATRTIMIIDTANDAFVAADQQGRIVEWRVRAEQLFGWSREEMLGQPLAAILASNQDLADLEESLQSRTQGARLEMKARDRTGREFPVELSISTLQLEDGVTFNVFVHDIGERKALELQLAHAQKLESIGQLATGIAHEINTPTQFVAENTRFLNDAFQDLQTLLDTYKRLLGATQESQTDAQRIAELEAVGRQVDVAFLEEEVPQAISQNLEGLERVTSIIRALNTFSHPNSSNEKVRVDINKGIESAITIARNEWKYVADLETDFDLDLPLVPCLAGEFNQVILNLIVNAAHAITDAVGDSSTAKGTITISTRRDGDSVEVRVRDTGTGIPHEIHSKVFDLFFTTKEVDKGTGQGLAIAHSTIVKKHGGTICFETKESQGTTFIIRLPLCSAAL